jgi:hypothetical protein
MESLPVTTLEFPATFIVALPPMIILQSPLISTLPLFSIISNLLPTILLTFEPSGCSSVKVPVGWAL